MKKLPTPTQIMDYSDEDLENFYEKLTKEYKNYFYQSKYREQGPVFNQVLKKAKVKNGTQITSVIRVAIEEKIRRLILKIATIQYRRMEKSEDYGELGEQRVALSYCRMLLNVPDTREVSQNEIDAFYVKIAELQRPIEKYSVDRLENLEYRQKVDILGKPFDFFQDKEINEHLKFLASERRMIVGYLGNFRSILYGYAEEDQHEGYTVYRFIEEEARTPANVLSIAAVVGGKQIAIRHESCETIFANKWRKMFQYESNELRAIMSDQYGNVGEVFKLKALESYKAKGLEGLDELRKKFINEMLEGLLIHELGHGIVINELLTKEDSAFGEAISVLGSNIVSVQKEILADWAPRKGKLAGPIQRFLEISVKDKKKATRMLYVYMSDNWFLGTSTESFDNHTDIMISLLLPYIKKDSSINFPKLKKDLQGKKSLFEAVLKDYKRIVQYLEKKVSHAKFHLDGKELSFKQLSEKIKKRVRKDEPGLAEDSVEFLVAFWAKILSELKDTNPKLLEGINECMSEENRKFHERLIVQIGGSKKEVLRERMIEVLKSNGFYLETTAISIRNAFEVIMDQAKAKYTPAVRKQVLDKLADVEQRGLTVSVNYEGEADPFVNVFQTILEKSGFGKIDSPLPMGEGISMDDGMSARKIAFNNEINNLVRSIREKLFSSIKELRISRRYTQTAWANKFLKKAVLYDGKAFMSKVGKVTFDDFKPTHIFEVFISPQKGYWDWNTVQAVLRMNKQVRPYSFDGYQRIDRLLLSAMAEEFFSTMDPLK